MQLAKHVSKGFWATAIQVLIALYGIAFMFLVVRKLPEEEYGNFVLVQLTYLIISNLGIAFAFSPMVKYYSEFEDKRDLLTSSLLLGMGFYGAMTLILWISRNAFGALLNSHAFPPLAVYIPILLLASVGKLFTNQVLRARYLFRHIFFTDLAYHGTAFLLFLWLTLAGTLRSASQVLQVISFAFIPSTLLGVWLTRKQLKFHGRLNFRNIKLLFNYGKFTLGSVTNSQIYDRADIFIISAFAGPVEVAIFNSAKLFMRLVETYRQVVNMLALPAFSRLHAEKRKKDIVAVYEKGILFSHVLLLGLAAGLILFAAPLFEFVYGGKYREGIIILQLLALTSPFLAWQCVGEGLLNGMGYPKIPFAARTITTAVKVILSLILIAMYQARGAAVASIVALAFLAILITRGVKSQIEFTWRGILRRYADLVNYVSSMVRVFSIWIFK